ncbi:hypothetical protein LguiA_032975 [Lonicera macranthoides]
MSLSKELIFLILQFCNEEDLKKTAHMLEEETGIFFDMMHFENLVLCGNWDEAERYLLGFIGIHDDKFSIKIYFEIRKQKFLEALDHDDRVKALDILLKDLKVFASSNEELYEEMTRLLTLDNFRTHNSLTLYGDTLSARKLMMEELRSIIEAYPPFQQKLKFPEINKSRLRRLINQSLNWQHINCTYPQPDPEMKTLFIDHQCQPPDLSHGQSIEKIPSPSKDTSTLVSPLSGTSTFNPSCTEALSTISDGALNPGFLTNPDVTSDSIKETDSVAETRSVGMLNEVASASTFPNQNHNSELTITDDFPKTVGWNLEPGSSPTTMDFHPIQQSLLLVGTDIGDVELWEVISGRKLLSRKFRVWKIKAISMKFLEDLVKDQCVAVNRILWSPDGSLFGVAYSKHIVQLYSYHSGNNIQKQLEIDAHVGGVNDLAFSKPNEQLCVITCGDDKLIKVWDVATGIRQFVFEGHEAPVYSIRSHVKSSIHFLFSTSTNGEIKGWLYDNLGHRISYDAPGLACTRMAYSADGKRLFSCGTNKEGVTSIVEWNESEGYVLRTYLGLSKCSSGVVQFGTSKNRFLAAGDEHLIKVWDFDSVELLATIDADGELVESPHICFNNNGTFLAVFANHNIIKILANSDGLQLLQNADNHFVDYLRTLSENLTELTVNPTATAGGAGATDGGTPLEDSLEKNEDTGIQEDEEPESPAEPYDVLEVRNFNVIDEPSQLQSLRLPSEMKMNKKISRLMYSNAGNAILALAANGIHLLWKWPKSETNSSAEPATKVAPQLCRPKSGLPMTNDLNGVDFKKSVACFAFSKNDCYVASASGGAVSLFNMMTFKKMRTFAQPKAAATCIAFYPQDNNIIAIGMEDSAIILYKFPGNEIIKELKAHSNGITSLAFSRGLNVLVSTGSDAQVVVWDSILWEKKKNRMLQKSVGRLPPSETYLQFHKDETHFLAVHDTHLAIYETTELKHVNQWDVGGFCARISHAAFSCDGHLVYAGFCDGTVLIFNTSNLHVKCEINPSAYLPSHISSNMYPFAVATHPRDPNQFALGLTDGGVVIIEPLESEGRWDFHPPVDNETMISTL